MTTQAKYLDDVLKRVTRLLHTARDAEAEQTPEPAKTD